MKEQKAAADEYMSSDRRHQTIDFIQSNYDKAYANWRRTGIPNLTPVDYPGNESNSQIPRRMRYSDSEYGNNTANVEEAIARQGADQFTTRIWWDQ